MMVFLDIETDMQQGKSSAILCHPSIAGVALEEERPETDLTQAPTAL